MHVVEEWICCCSTSEIWGFFETTASPSLCRLTQPGWVGPQPGDKLPFSVQGWKLSPHLFIEGGAGDSAPGC